jgi:hypothetical protein
MIIYTTVWLCPPDPDVVGPSGSLDYMVKEKMFTAEDVLGMAVDETRTVQWHGRASSRPLVITMEDVQSYNCNCCQTEQPGDGGYDICHNCGWENEPGETHIPLDSGGPNHMSLHQGRTNFAQYGHYKCKIGCNYMCMCGWS